MTKLEPLLTIPETQQILGNVSRHTIMRLLDRGELTRIRIVTRTLIDPESVRAYIERQKETPT